MNKKTIFLSFLHALISVTYIFVVVFVMQTVGKIFANDQSIIGAASFLLLFVISAAVMSVLVFGKPVLLYLENQKKDALVFLFLTLGWLSTFLILIFSFLIFFK